MQQYKIVVVGDGTVGKTSLLNAYVDDTFSLEYEATVFDNKETNIRVNNRDHYVLLFDTAGQESYSSVRPLSYQQTDLFIVCFSVNSDRTFSNLRKVWLPELQHHQPTTPFIIVGTKQDLRSQVSVDMMKADNDHDLRDGMRSEEFYESGCENLGGKVYIECSAKTRFNIERVFEMAMVEILKDKERKLKEKEKLQKDPSCFSFLKCTKCTVF